MFNHVFDSDVTDFRTAFFSAGEKIEILKVFVLFFPSCGAWIIEDIPDMAYKLRFPTEDTSNGKQNGRLYFH